MGDDTTTDLSTHHRDLTDGNSSPEVCLIEALVELTGTDETELPQLYSSVDQSVGHLLRSPPPTRAQAELTFTYAGYRITVYQDGHADFQPLG